MKKAQISIMPIDAVLTCCRDEEDIIDTFVLFYLDLGFDAVYVIVDPTLPRASFNQCATA